MMKSLMNDECDLIFSCVAFNKNSDSFKGDLRLKNKIYFIQ